MGMHVEERHTGPELRYRIGKWPAGSQKPTETLQSVQSVFRGDLYISSTTFFRSEFSIVHTYPNSEMYVPS
jgi:hypothetical protein